MNILMLLAFIKRSFGITCMRNENVKSNTNSSNSVISRQDLPKLELLRSFESAARTLSFTVAANELFLTQSAVSRQIQQLEASVGTDLFQRQHRALALTDAGRTLQRAVVDSLERLRDATLVIRASLQPATPVRQVAVTCTPGFASLWLIPRLVRFTANHPQVDVRISATLDVLDLNHSQIDFAIRFCPTATGEGAPLFEETLLPVCAPSLLKNLTNPLRTPADLVNHTLLIVDNPGNYPTGTPLTVEWEPWLKVMGLQEVRTKNTLRFTSYADSISAAMAGQGVAIGRFPLLEDMLHDKRLVTPFTGAAASHRGYYLTMGSRAAINSDAQDFAAWLRVEAKQAKE
jgi:LysR family transcriptional regulator, glycine cleavage system transcriptional activator